MNFHEQGLSLLPLSCLLFLISCAESAPTENIPADQAVAYEVILVEDTSIRTRDRRRVSIVAEAAKTLDQRAHTALAAARDLQQSGSVDAVGVFLEINQELSGLGYALAIADYAPDGGGWSGGDPFEHGTWQIRATAEVIPDQAIQVATFWHQHESDFQVDDGFGGTTTDEDKLDEYVAEVMGIQPSEIDMDFVPLLNIITSRNEYDGRVE